MNEENRRGQMAAGFGQANVVRSALRKRIRWGLAAGPTAGLVSVLVALVPMASAGATTFVPGFSGALSFASSTVAVVNCGTATNLGAATANTATGNVTLGGKVGAPLCGSSLDAGTASAVAGFEGPNFTVATAGSHTMKMHWLFDYSAKTSLMIANASSGAYAYLLIAVYGIVHDETNNTTFASPTPVVYLAYSFSASSGSFHVAKEAFRATLVITASLATGHVYEFYTAVVADVAAVAGNGNTASGQFNLGTHGEGGSLQSLTVS